MAELYLVRPNARVTLLYFAIGLHVVLVALRVGLIAVGCFAFHHWLRMKALPWVGAWYAVGYIAELVSTYAYVHCAPSDWKPESHTPPPPGMAALSTAMIFTADISALLVVLLIFSEAASVMQRLYPEFRPMALRALCRLYSHVVVLGVSAVTLVVAEPLFPLVYCYARVHR